MAANTVRPTTQRGNTEAPQDLRSWSRWRTRPSYGAAAWDVSWAGDLEECCNWGLPATLVNQLVAAVAWASPSIGRLLSATRPMSARSLAGWRRIVSGTSRPPMPKMVAFALAADLVARSLGLLGLSLVVLLETSARPLEALLLRGWQVVRPTE